MINTDIGIMILQIVIISNVILKKCNFKKEQEKPVKDHRSPTFQLGTEMKWYLRQFDKIFVLMLYVIFCYPLIFAIL